MKQNAAQKASILSQASSRKITSFASNSSKFNYKHPEASKYDKFSSQDVNYSEFTRDLVKMQCEQSKIAGNMTSRLGSTMNDRTNMSTLSTKFNTSTRLGKITTTMSSTR